MSHFDELRRRRADELDGALERRGIENPGLQVREMGRSTGPRADGYASTTGDRYPVGIPERGGWFEVIQPGAFRRCLSESPDVVLNILHGRGGSGLPLARTKSGTLHLFEDERGLRFEADLDPDDPDVAALLPKLRRGDVDGASMGFRVTDQAWSDDRSIRTIKSVTLHKGDVSIVDFGANPNASTQLTRSASGAYVPVFSAVQMQSRRQRERLALARLRR